MKTNLPAPPQITLYQTEDNRTRIEVRIVDDTVWLTQAHLAELYQTTPQNITLHVAAIYEDGELVETATCKDYLQVRQEGQRQVERRLKHYNLEMVLAIGYRVRSHRGTQFRRWATERLREYLVNGFTQDDERLKQGGTKNEYYAELQAMEQRPMHMRDWIAKLDAFLRAGDREILDNAGSISADEARKKAELEFEKFDQQRRQLEDAKANADLAQDIDDLAKQAKQLRATKRKPK